MRGRLTNSSSPSCQLSSGKVFPFLHRGIVTWRSACSEYNNFRTASFSCITKFSGQGSEPAFFRGIPQFPAVNENQMDDVKRAIESADAATLEKLLRENVLCANDLITWGELGRIHTHPLHYISDMLIAGTLPRG